MISGCWSVPYLVVVAQLDPHLYFNTQRKGKRSAAICNPTRNFFKHLSHPLPEVGVDRHLIFHIGSNMTVEDKTLPKAQQTQGLSAFIKVNTFHWYHNLIKIQNLDQTSAIIAWSLSTLLNYNTIDLHWVGVGSGRFPEKKCILSGIARIGGMALPNFFGTFSKNVFFGNKRLYM